MPGILREGEYQVLGKESPVDVQFLKENHIDFAVSYSHRYIIKSDVLNYMKNRIINLHISYLSWNRGADPNPWSFLEDTLKGMAIHHMSDEIDTGNIIAQKERCLDNRQNTLATTYACLQEEMTSLFKETWPLISVEGVKSLAATQWWNVPSHPATFVQRGGYACE